MTKVPVPPASGLVPRIDTWTAGRILWRCHDPALAANQFNPGLGQGRFHPIMDARTGMPIPTLYASDQMSGAFSWVSRQNDRALAVTLFGDRVDRYDLDVLVDSVPLDSGNGWQDVLRYAAEADITVVV